MKFKIKEAPESMDVVEAGHLVETEDTVGEASDEQVCASVIRSANNL
jgi:hypothetical protein